MVAVRAQNQGIACLHGEPLLLLTKIQAALLDNEQIKYLDLLAAPVLIAGLAVIKAAGYIMRQGRDAEQKRVHGLAS